MRKVKIRSKQQLQAHRSARAPGTVTAPRRSPIVITGGETTIDLPTPEEIERFAVGGCGGNCPPMACSPQPMPCRPSSLNDCYHEVAQKYGCPLKVASGGVIGVDGQARIAFRVEPVQSNYFLPIAVRLTGRSRDDPDQLLIWRLTAVMVKNQPQENYHEPNPSVDTVVGVESVAYDGRTAGEVPAYEVGWGPFSRSAMADHLELVGWNGYPAGVFMTARAEIWGYPINTLPEGWSCGTHPGPTASPRTPVVPSTSSGPVSASLPTA
ncbi:MAG: hypothetical protein AB1Z98_18790 [Nannocystaceae bacterium]